MHIVPQGLRYWSTSAPGYSLGESHLEWGNSLILAAIMDVMEIEALSHVKQEIMRWLILEASHWGCSPLAKVVINAVVGQFIMFAPTQNSVLQNLGFVLHSQHAYWSAIGEYLVVFMPFWACHVKK